MWRTDNLPRDLKHVVGVVESISSDGQTVVVMPQTGNLNLKHGLSFMREQIQKWFKMGDHVKVVGGSRYVGETGLVVRVGKQDGSDAGDKPNAASPDVLHIFSDISQAEIVVQAAFVRECNDVSSGLEQLGQYKLHDLVELLEPRGVGMIVKVEHTSFKVCSPPRPTRLTPHPKPDADHRRS